jgi:phosphoenolpyruvate-protein phosphotransferase (PTS system enzyme I)
MSEPRAKQRLELTGASIAPGLVLGKAYLLRQISLDALEMRPLPVGDPTAEIERLGRAFDQTLDQLRQLQAKVDRDSRRDVADIFETQLSLLGDVTFLQGIREAVRAQAVNPEHLIAVEIRRLESTFEGMKDEVLRSRFLDIKDVYHRLLRNLLEIEHVRTNPFRKLASPIVLVADRMLPSDVALLELGKVLGIVIEEGSRVSHVAIIAKSLGIPALTEVRQATAQIRSGDTVLVDGTGRLLVHPDAADLAWYEDARQGRSLAAHVAERPAGAIPPCQTADGVRIALEANVGSLREAEEALACGAEGIGLLRSEFFYMSCRQVPTVREEARFYRDVLAAMRGRPVTIRLLDLGADKCLPYLKMPREENPQLGTRGVRALLRMPELLQRHVSTVLRASDDGPVRILLPFVSTLTDLQRVLEVIHESCRSDRIARERFQVGLMVEVPAVALGLKPFLQDLDFFSIGTNDLVQYVFAASREDSHLEEYCLVHHPTMLRLIRSVASTAHTENKPVSVCGEIASDPALAPLLVGLGIDSLSVYPAAVPLVRETIRRHSHPTLTRLAHRALRVADAASVLALLEGALCANPPASTQPSCPQRRASRRGGCGFPLSLSRE